MAETDQAPSTALASLPPARREILLLLKKRGEATAAELAGALGITVSGVRQQLAGLAADGWVAHRVERVPTGRPRHRHRLTPGADSLFPRAYSELTNELLAFVDDDDPGLVDRAFERRRGRRAAGARRRLAGLAFADQVAELARILDEDGYLAEFEARPDGSFVVTEHNCAILGVARRFGSACSSEIGFLRDALPGASIERVAHMMAGAHVCAYEIRRAAPARARQSPVNQPRML